MRKEVCSWAARAFVLPLFGVLLYGAAIFQSAAAAADACALLTREEIVAAFGRSELGAPKAAKAGAGTSDCRYPGGQRGDVRIVIAPREGADDFALRGRILKDEGHAFEVVRGIGEGAYVWADSVQVFARSRTLSIWLIRKSASEPEPQVRQALVALAKAGAARL